MTVVVADTSPVNYLILLDHIDLLRVFYGSILIPTAVHRELLSSDAPPKVRAWSNSLPPWVRVSVSPPVQPLLTDLDAGETEAIALALNVRADWLLIDEIAGRTKASRLGLHIIGTLGVLREAHRASLLDFSAVITRLQALGFRASPAVLQGLLDSI